MAYELAKAYVEIVPSAEGLGASIIDELGDAGDKAGEDSGKRASGAFGRALSTAGKVAGAAVGLMAAGIGAVSATLTKGISDVAAYGDNIDKMSQKMGLSAEAYQEWDFIMQHNGTSIESLQASMKTLANAVDSGNEAFGRIGLTQEEIAGMSNEDLFAATIAGLQNVSDETERTYLAGQLLGRGATELGPLLNMTAEETEAMRQQVHDLGGVLSDEAVKAAAGYQDSLQNLQTSFAGLKNNIMAEFLPGVTSVFDGLTAIMTGDSEGGLGLIRTGVEDLISSLSDLLPQVMEVGGSIVSSLLQAIAENAPTIIEAGAGLLFDLVDGVLGALGELAPMAADIITTIVDQLTANLPGILTAALEIIVSLATGIGEALPTLIPAIVDCVLTIVETLTQPDSIQMVIGAALTLILGLVDGIIQAIPQIIDALPMIIDNIILGLVGAIPQIAAAGVQLITSIVSNLPQIIAGVIRAIPQIIASLVRGIVQAVPQMAQAGLQLIRGLFQGISNAVGWLYGQLRGWVNNVLSYIKGLFGIHSPSTEMAWVGEMLAAGVAEGIEEGAPLAVDAMQDMADELRGVDLTAGVQDAVADVTLRTRALTGAVSAPGASAGVSPAGDLAGAVMALSAKLDRMAVYIYGDKLVGYLATDIDQALGSRAILAGRGSLA